MTASQETTMTTTDRKTLTDTILDEARSRGYEDVRYERYADTARFAPLHRVEDYEEWKRMAFLLSDIHPGRIIEDEDGNRGRLGAGLNVYNLEGSALLASLSWAPARDGSRETDLFFVVTD